MAMKTTKSNWRLEVRPAVFAVVTGHSSDEICEEVCNDLMQEMIDGQCPEIPAHCVEVKCDEERVCDYCGHRWVADKKGNLFLRCIGCGRPIKDKKGEIDVYTDSNS